MVASKLEEARNGAPIEPHADTVYLTVASEDDPTPRPLPPGVRVPRDRDRRPRALPCY